MLLQEKINNTAFSPTEKVVIDFILEKKELIQDYSTTKIAKSTYTSPSILVRISKKLGFNGFNEFKKAYVEELTYLQKSFKDVDPNLPFTAMSSMMDVTSSIATLKQNSIEDTLSLLKHDDLMKALNILKKAKTIKIFTIANLTFLAEEFVFKLHHIGVKAETYSFSNTMIQESHMATADDCAIFLSYSGESDEVIRIAGVIQQKKIPSIAITSIGQNTLSSLCDVSLRLCTRERSYSKIGNFSSLESFQLILDILYGCYFKIDYQKHLDYKLYISKQTEDRKITNEIIKEK